MLQHFDQIKIDNLNGDKYRTGKRTPEGLPDPSIFSTEENDEGIQPGTAITTLVRSRDIPSSNISIRSLWGEGKRAQLLREASGPLETPYSEIVPEPILGLPYAELTYTKQYLDWPLLSGLFRTNFNGVQTSRDHLLVDIDRALLEEWMKQFLDPTTEQSIYHIWQIRRFLYRPFDLRFVYWEGNSDLLVRSREEYIGGHYGNISIVLSKQDRVSYAGPLVSTSIADLNCVDGGANIFSESFTTLDPLHGVAMLDNWSPAALGWLDKVRVDSSALFFHILATSHCSNYADQNVRV